MREEVLRMESIVKMEDGICLLDNFSLNIFQGEIMGLLGLSNTGKSVISKILAGVDVGYTGAIYVNEQLVASTPAAYRVPGVFCVFANEGLVGSLSIAENLFVLRGSAWDMPIIQQKIIQQEASAILERVGLGDVSPKLLVSNLSLVEQYLIQIGKALASDAKLIVMDTVLESLSFMDRQRLIGVINQQKTLGMSFLIISCQPDELTSFSDRITILRDGCNIKTFFRGDFDTATILKIFIGHDLTGGAVCVSHVRSEPVLQMQHVFTEQLHDINMTLHKGEIVGLWDLEGQSDLAICRLLEGQVRMLSGGILLNGARINLRSPANAVHSGIGIIEHQSLTYGLINNLSPSENINFSIYSKLSRFGVLSPSSLAYLEREQRKKLGDLLDARTVQELGIHAQFRILFEKWLLARPAVLLCINPIAVADVITKNLFFDFFDAITADGTAILLSTPKLDDAVAVCDRILMLSNGCIRKEFTSEMMQEFDFRDLYTL